MAGETDPEKKQVAELTKKIGELEKGKAALDETVNGLTKEKAELEGLKTASQDEVRKLKKKRIWGVGIAVFFLLVTAAIMVLLVLKTSEKTLSAEQAAVFSIMMIGWFTLIVTFIRTFGCNDDTWR